MNEITATRGRGVDMLTHLAVLAGAASRGPWECREGDGLTAILTQDGWLNDCSAEQDVANNRFIAAANPAVVRVLVAIAQRADKCEAAAKPWTRVEDAVPERMSDGRQFSRQVLVANRNSDTPPRMSRVHYYDNHPPVWEGGDPTHWCDLPDLPNDDEPGAVAVAPDAVSAGDMREADRALKSIRRVIEQDIAREGDKATLALLLDDDVCTLQQFVDAHRIVAPARTVVSAAQRAVLMPRNISETTLLVAAAALRAGLCELTGSDGTLAKKVFDATFAQLAKVDHGGTVLRTAEYVMLPADLDDDLLRAGIDALRKALNLRTGLDMFAAKATYEGLYASLATCKAVTK